MKLSHESGQVAGVTSAPGTFWGTAGFPAMANPGPSTGSVGVLVKLHACFLEKWRDQSRRCPEVSDQGCSLHKSRRKLGKDGKEGNRGEVLPHLEFCVMSPLALTRRDSAWHP